MADYSSILPISLSANFGASYIPNYCAILPVGDTNNTTMTLTIVFWVSVRDLGELNPLMPDDVPTRCPQVILDEASRCWIPNVPVEVGLGWPDKSDPLDESVTETWMEESCNPLQEQVRQVIAT